MNTEDFIIKSKSIYGDKLDYTNVQYINAKTKIHLICKEHSNGYFQTPNHHFSNNGCKFCIKNSKQKNKLLDRKLFLEKCESIYKDNIYSYGDYIGAKKDIKIYCNRHDYSFTQKVDNHYLNTACIGCILEIRQEKFINKSNIIHDNTYSYDNVIYKNDRSQVIITCQIHGDFKQTPSAHRQGKGCPSCKKTGYQVTKNGYLYIQELSLDNSIIGYKFGITNKIPIKRMKIQNSKSLLNHQLIFEFYGDGNMIYNFENYIKENIKGSFLSKELMKDGYTETISPDDFQILHDLIITYITEDKL